MQKKIEIILTPKENSNGYKNLDTTQFIAFLAATKDICEEQEELALINNFLNTFEKEKTNE